MIYKDSRYSSGNISREYSNQHASYQVMVRRVFPTAKARFYLYTWKEQDRIDLVAKDRLGHANLWWKILDYNPEILNAWDIAPGTILRIPNVV